MRLVMDKSRYDTPKGPRFVLACSLEAFPEKAESLRTFVPSSGFGPAGDVWDLLHHGVTYEARNVKDVVDRANDESVRASSVGGSKRRWNSRARRRWTSEQRSDGRARS